MTERVSRDEAELFDIASKALAALMMGRDDMARGELAQYLTVDQLLDIEFAAAALQLQAARMRRAVQRRPS